MTIANSQSQLDSQAARSQTAKILDQSFLWGTRILAIAVGAVLLWISVQVARNSIPAIQEFGLQFLIQSEWNPVEDIYGVLPMIYGTLLSSLIALLLAVPIGLASAIILSENFLPLSIRTILAFLVELLAAIPSIVYGLWGIYVLIPFLKPIGNWLHENFAYIPLFSTQYIGLGMLPAGFILAIMILPIITVIARDSLASLPSELRWGSYGVGATRWQTIFSILIPAAFSGIVGGIMLGLGRALGETMAVTLVIGNSNNLDLSILAPANTIASLLANQFAEASGLQRASLFYAGLILFVITLVVNVLAELIVRRVKKF
jgi:phosphate transport system permease protein